MCWVRQGQMLVVRKRFIKGSDLLIFLQYRVLLTVSGELFLWGLGSILSPCFRGTSPKGGGG